MVSQSGLLNCHSIISYFFFVFQARFTNPLSKGSFFLPITSDNELESELFGVLRPDLAERYSFVLVCKKKAGSSFKPQLNSTLKAPKSLRLKSFPEEEFNNFCEKAKLTEELKRDFVDLVAEILARGFEVADDADSTTQKTMTPSFANGLKRDFGDRMILQDDSHLEVSSISRIPSAPPPSPAHGSLGEENNLRDELAAAINNGQSVEGGLNVPVSVNPPKVTAQDFFNILIQPYYLEAFNIESSSEESLS